MSKTLSLTFENSGVVWMNFPKEVQSKLIKAFQLFVSNPKNSMEHEILKLFNNVNLKSTLIKKEGFFMGEEITSNIVTLRFEFKIKESLNNLRVIANSTLKNKQIKKPEVKERFINASLTPKEVYGIQQKLKKNADGMIKNSKGKIQVNFINLFTVLWYDFLRSKNPSTLFKKKLIKQIRLRLSLPYKTKRIITLSTVIVVIIGLIFIGISLSKPPQILVGKYDLVTLDYQMWESDYAQDYDPLNPLIDETIVITIIPITEDKNNGLILGLFNNIIGKKLFYESDLIWLDKCIDQNRDGLDDVNINKAALTYGNSTDQYFNMCLVIKFKILSIEKPN